MEEINTELFLETIYSDGAEDFGLNKNHSGVIVATVCGKNGRHIFIDTTDETIPVQLAKLYLSQLGMTDLISILFP